MPGGFILCAMPASRAYDCSLILSHYFKYYNYGNKSITKDAVLTQKTGGQMPAGLEKNK